MNQTISFKKLKTTLLIIIIPLVFILPLLFIAQHQRPADVSEGWQYKYGDSPKDSQGTPLWVYSSPADITWKPFSYPGQPPINPDYSNVWLRVRLPMEDYELPSIMFTTNDQIFEVYLEDKLIYGYGDIEHYNDKIAPGSPWHLISLPEDYHGKMLYLRMHTSFNRNAGLVRRFEIGSKLEHMTYLISNEIDNILLTCLFTFMGFCLIFIFAVRRTVKTEFPALGCFSICIGVWLLAETNFKQLILYAPRLWLYVAFLSFYLTPVGLLKFVERVFSPGNIYLQMMQSLHIAFAAAAFLLDVTRLLPYIFTLQAFYVLLFLSVITIFVTIAKAARTNSPETKIFVLGFTVLILFGLYDVLGMYFRVVPWSQYVIPYGMFLFLLSMVYLLGMRIADVYDKTKLYSEDIKQKNEALNKAYEEVNASKEKLTNWNKDLEKIVQERTSSIRTLLDNAGQGFLTFGQDLAIDGEFSSECCKLFDCNIAGKLFPELIYPDNKEERAFLSNLLVKILEENRQAQRNVYLSLLPKEIAIGDKYISLCFKLIQDKRLSDSEVFMVILTDITYSRILESRVEKERNILKMIVKVFTSRNEFAETVKEYKSFCRHTLPGLLRSEKPSSEVLHDIYLSVHSFKGSFSLFEMANIIDKLHRFENKIAECNTYEGVSGINRLKEYIGSNDLEGWLDEDINVLKTILGDKILDSAAHVVVSKDSLIEIENKILQLLPHEASASLLPDIRKLRLRPFSDVLKGLPEFSQRLADRMNKLIRPVEIKEEAILVDMDRYQGFSRALVHLFRNIIDHGLETAAERLESGKSEYGSICCSIWLSDGKINLSISEDGRGFDYEVIRQKLIERELVTKELACCLPEAEALNMAISNHISTKNQLTHYSGRGLGISLIKEETEKLGGTLKIESAKGRGSRFLFELPYDC